MKLVLASESPYRRELLSRLGLPFTAERPRIDEEPLKTDYLRQGKSPIEIAAALAEAKARSLNDPGSLIIGGDQLVSFENDILGKPGSLESAKTQLNRLNGRTHQLITCLYLWDGTTGIGHTHLTQLTMKSLSPDEITNYLHRDRPFDCAGSYRIEASGIALFSSIDGDDFTAIQGMPMIWLSNQLKELGYEFFQK